MVFKFIAETSDRTPFITCLAVRFVMYINVTLCVVLHVFSNGSMLRINTE